jgi:hypothetical protein
LARPLCNAKPGDDCKTASGADIEVVHVARIKAAKDAGTKRGRVL